MLLLYTDSLVDDAKYDLYNAKLIVNIRIKAVHLVII